MEMCHDVRVPVLTLVFTEKKLTFYDRYFGFMTVAAMFIP